ncbi:hypothetical protein Droror1_Dr00009336 [Drosera rotundifolia]
MTGAQYFHDYLRRKATKTKPRGLTLSQPARFLRSAMAAKRHDKKAAKSKETKTKKPKSVTKSQSSSPIESSKIQKSSQSKLQPKKNEFKKPAMKKQQQKHEDALDNHARRQRAKELADARKKKRKRHFTLEQELALLWEKMRRRNISKEKRLELISEALLKMKGIIAEIAGSHVSSRVLQTCVKYCSEAERNTVFEELRPHFLALATNTYAVHLVKKMLDNASKVQLAGFIASLHGHVAVLLRHMVGSVVVEHAYQLANATQKRGILMELYSTELRLFKDLTTMSETRLVDIISKLGLKRSSVLHHMASILQPILEKGIVDHSIIHKVLMEYLSIADQSSAADVVQQLSGALLVRIVHTRDGSKIGILCIKHGSAKERKKMIKGMKGLVGKIARDHCGSLVLVCLLCTVDDTKLLTKVIIHEIQSILKELVLCKNGRLPLLHLLNPHSHRYLGPDDLASLSVFIPSFRSESGEELQLAENKLAKSTAEDNEGGHDTQMAIDEAEGSNKPGKRTRCVEGGKKDPFVRRQELLVNSGLAESLIETCIENSEELLKSNFGKEVIYEVVRGGADGILGPTFTDKLTTLREAIASLAARPKPADNEKKDDHVLLNFHSSRTIRKLVLDCPPFASILWKEAIKGKSETWANDHSAKVISAFLDSQDPKIRKLVEPELLPLKTEGRL